MLNFIFFLSSFNVIIMPQNLYELFEAKFCFTLEYNCKINLCSDSVEVLVQEITVSKEEIDQDL